jgi:hypothetical protein
VLILIFFLLVSFLGSAIGKLGNVFCSGERRNVTYDDPTLCTVICCNLSHWDWTRLYNITRMIKLRRVRWVGLRARGGGGEKMCTRSFGKETWTKKTNGKTQAYTRKYYHGFSRNIMDGWGTVGGLLCTVTNLRFSSNAGNFLTSRRIAVFFRRTVPWDCLVS